MLITLLAGVVTIALVKTEMPSQAADFHVVSDENSLTVQLDGKSIATYYLRHRDVARPFFAHVRTRSETQVTRNFPPVDGTDPTDHAAMHPGIWLAFANINGVNFWHNQEGTILHDGFESKPEAGESVQFATRERYVDEHGEIVCRAVTRYRFDSMACGWLLMIDTSLRSRDGLVFVVKEEMGLGVRVATAISVKAGNGSILSASGGTDEQGTWGKHDRWWDYFGQVDDREVGIMVMSAPDNPPIWSHSRDYGLLVANPFPVDIQTNRGKQTIVKREETLQLRFAILIHETDSQASIDRKAIYEQILHGGNLSVSPPGRLK